MSDGQLDRAGRAERRAVVAFGAATLASLGLAVLYWRGGQPQVEGLLLGVGLGGIGYGLVTWANHILFDGHKVQAREPIASSEADRQAGWWWPWARARSAESRGLAARDVG